MGLSTQSMGFSSPSTGKAGRASLLRASLRSVLPLVQKHNNSGVTCPLRQRLGRKFLSGTFLEEVCPQFLMPPCSEPRFARSCHRFRPQLTGLASLGYVGGRKSFPMGSLFRYNML